MTTAEFSEHIKDLARSTKKLVAEIASEEVAKDAQQVQSEVRVAQQKGHGDGSGPSEDGYELLTPATQEKVDDYLTNYGIDLLNFDQGSDTESIRSQLENDHLTWMVTQFDRLDSLPAPKKSEPVVESMLKVSGDGELVKVKESASDGDIQKKLEDNVSAGEGILGSRVFSWVGPIGVTVSGWDSGAADMFKNEFLPFIPAAVANQIIAAKTLRNLMAVHQGMLTAVRKSIDTIAHNGKTAVESHERSCGAAGDAGGDRQALAIITQTATILSIVSGPLAIPVNIVKSASKAAEGSEALRKASERLDAGSTAMSVVSGTTGSIKTAAGAEKKKLPLGGENLEETVTNIKEAVEATFKDLDEGYTELVDNGMKVVAGKLDDNISMFISPRPDDIADAGTGDSESGKQEVLEAIDE